MAPIRARAALSVSLWLGAAAGAAIELKGIDGQRVSLDVHLPLESAGRAMLALASLVLLLPSNAGSDGAMRWAHGAGVTPKMALVSVPKMAAAHYQPVVSVPQFVKMLVRGNMLIQAERNAFLTSLADHIDVFAPYRSVAAATVGGSVVRHDMDCSDYAHPVLESWRHTAGAWRSSEYLHHKAHVLDTLEVRVPQYAPDIWASASLASSNP
jgi:hypothetical protein